MSERRGLIGMLLVVYLAVVAALTPAEGIPQIADHGRPPIAQEQAQPHTEPTERDNSAAHPLYVKASCEHGCGYAEDNKGMWEKLRTDPVADFTAVLAIATIALGLATKSLWGETKTLAEHSEKQLTKMGEYITATNNLVTEYGKQVANMESALDRTGRAFLSATTRVRKFENLSLRERAGARHDQGVGWGQAYVDLTVEYTLTIKNIGASDGLITGIAMDHYRSITAFRGNDGMGNMTHFHNPISASGMTTDLPIGAPFEVPITWQFRSSAEATYLEGDDSPLVIGTIFYEDVFLQPRERGFAFRFTAGVTLNPPLGGLLRWGGKEYNYDRRAES